jgi:DNA mismatch repair ATPase MutL
MNDIIANNPNAAKLVSSVRNSGYDSYAAVEDIIDNSIDAHARTINVTVGISEKQPHLIIADNGVGMSNSILDEALKLGSMTEKDDVSDLGKYGMGLCTASISMARRLEVISKQADGEMFYTSQDLDEIVKENRFVKSCD